MRLQNIDLHGILIWIEIFSALETMLQTHNPFPEIFQFGYEVLQRAGVESMPLSVFMKVVTEERMDQRVYNQPAVDEVAALVSDDNTTPATRDVFVRLRPTTANTISSSIVFMNGQMILVYFMPENYFITLCNEPAICLGLTTTLTDCKRHNDWSPTNPLNYYICFSGPNALVFCDG